MDSDVKVRLRRALALIAVLALLAVAVASGAAGRREFFLDVRPHQCLIAAANTGNASHKTVLHVPCSNPAHDLEPYAIGHGGWGTAPPSHANVLAEMRASCLALFQRVTGHPMPRTEGWYAFAADPGAEAHRYGDRIICSLRTWPRLQPLGAGWHVR
jgi:hypothetical protein